MQSLLVPTPRNSLQKRISSHGNIWAVMCVGPRSRPVEEQIARLLTLCVRLQGGAVPHPSLAA
jgi:hypothetical protein